MINLFVAHFNTRIIDDWLGEKKYFDFFQIQLILDSVQSMLKIFSWSIYDNT